MMFIRYSGKLVRTTTLRQDTYPVLVSMRDRRVEDVKDRREKYEQAKKRIQRELGS